MSYTIMINTHTNEAIVCDNRVLVQEKENRKYCTILTYLSILI